MSKISELSDGGVIQGGDTLIAVRSGGNVKVTYGGSTTANIDGGTIDGTVIGGSSAAAGTFTTVTATSNIDTSAGYLFGATDSLIYESAADTATLRVGSNGPYTLLGKDLGSSASGMGNTSGTLALYAVTEQVRITSSGLVGIGTSIPAAKLHVAGETRIYPASGTAVLRFGENTTEKGKLSVDNTSNMVFETANLERMRIDSAGNVIFGPDSYTDHSDVVIRGGTKTEGINAWDGTQITLKGGDAIIGGGGGGAGDLLLSGGDATKYANSNGHAGDVIISGGTVTTAGFGGSLNNGEIVFETAGTEVGRWDSAGHLIVPEGITLGTAVGTYNAANTLDDYEEGTWTATIADAQTGGNTGSTHTGRYRKIGTLVTVFCTMTNIDTTGLTATNVMYVQGLPFTSNANNNTQGMTKIDQVLLTTGRTYIYSQISGNATWLNFQTAGSSVGEDNVDAQHITSGVSDIQFTIQYIV